MGWAERKSLMQGSAVRTFPEAVTYQATASDTPKPMQGIWRDAHIEVDPETSITVSSTEPLIDLQLSDIPGEEVTKGARIVRDSFPGKVYEVIDHEPDGEGMTRLILHKGKAF